MGGFEGLELEWAACTALSNHDAFHLVERDFLGSAVVKLRRACHAWFAIRAARSSVPPFFR